MRTRHGVPLHTASSVGCTICANERTIDQTHVHLHPHPGLRNDGPAGCVAWCCALVGGKHHESVSQDPALSRQQFAPRTAPACYVIDPHRLEAHEFLLPPTDGVEEASSLDAIGGLELPPDPIDVSPPVLPNTVSDVYVRSLARHLSKRIREAEAAADAVGSKRPHYTGTEQTSEHVELVVEDLSLSFDNPYAGSSARAAAAQAGLIGKVPRRGCGVDRSRSAPRRARSPSTARVRRRRRTWRCPRRTRCPSPADAVPAPVHTVLVVEASAPAAPACWAAGAGAPEAPSAASATG